jgi:hypothetical protein
MAVLENRMNPIHELIEKLANSTRHDTVEYPGLFCDIDEVDDTRFFKNLLLEHRIDLDHSVRFEYSFRSSEDYTPLIYDVVLKYFLWSIYDHYRVNSRIDYEDIEIDAQELRYFTYFDTTFDKPNMHRKLFYLRFKEFFIRVVFECYEALGMENHQYFYILMLLREMFETDGGVFEFQLEDLILECVLEKGKPFIEFYYDFHFMLNNRLYELYGIDNDLVRKYTRSIDENEKLYASRAMYYMMMDDSVNVLSRYVGDLYSKQTEELVFYSLNDFDQYEHFRQRHESFQPYPSK